MKKIVALGMALLLLLGAMPCLAEEVNATIGLTENMYLAMEVPEGYTVQKDRSDTVLYATIFSEETGKTLYNFSIAYADLSEGPTPGEMTEEDIELAKQMISADFFKPTYTIAVTGGGTKFLVIDENEAESDYTLMIANYQGYFVQMYITPAENMEVTEADVTTALEILTSIQLMTE